MLIFIIVFSFAFKIEIKCNGIRAWESWNNRIKPVDILAPGLEFPVIWSYAPYYRVLVLTGDHKNELGFMFGICIDEKNGNILIEGCTLRSSPEKDNNGTPEDTADDPNFMAKIGKGRKVKILKKIVNRYKIKPGYMLPDASWKTAWVWAPCVRVIK